MACIREKEDTTSPTIPLDSLGSEIISFCFLVVLFVETIIQVNYRKATSTSKAFGIKDSKKEWAGQNAAGPFHKQVEDCRDGRKRTEPHLS